MTRIMVTGAGFYTAMAVRRLIDAGFDVVSFTPAEAASEGRDFAYLGPLDVCQAEAPQGSGPDWYQQFAGKKGKPPRF